jgi:hypothetical protein
MDCFRNRFVRWSKGLACLVGAAAGGTTAHAVDWQPYPASLNTHFVNARPAAMGEAFTAVADDHNALYYNPAGLARLGTWGIDYLEILAPVIAASGSVYEAVDSIQKLMKTDTSKIMSDVATYEKVRSIIKDMTGKPYYARFGLNPFFVKQNFGFALYENNEVSLSLRLGSPLAQIEYTTDADARFGYAQNLFSDKLAVGGALGYRFRGNLDYSARFESYGAIAEDKEWYKKELKTGQAIVADAGILFTPVETWSPTFGLAVQNIGDARFFKASFTKEYSTELPENIPQTVNMGFSVTPKFGERLFARAAVDFRDVNLPVPASQKLRIGLEGGLNRLITAQLGLANQGISAGFEARLFLLNVRYATYVVERGYATGQQPERRHQVNFKILL